MALKVTGFATSALPYKVVTETASTNTMGSNVTGATGTMYSLDFDNQANATVYLKCHLSTTGGTLGGDEDIKIRFPTGANGKKRIVMPAGIAFTELSLFTTTTHGTSGTPAAPSTGAIISATTT